MIGTARRHAESIEVSAPPEQVYALVTDVTRTGEWSPVCTGCWWDTGDAPAPGGSPRVGARFTGRNETPDRTWETRSTVVAADPGREFAWEVGQGYVRWGYVLQPGATPGTTVLTETWEFTPAGLDAFAQRYGDDAEAQIDLRTTQAREGIPATLARIRQIAEGV